MLLHRHYALVFHQLPFRRFMILCWKFLRLQNFPVDTTERRFVSDVVRYFMGFSSRASDKVLLRRKINWSHTMLTCTPAELWRKFVDDFVKSVVSFRPFSWNNNSLNTFQNVKTVQLTFLFQPFYRHCRKFPLTNFHNDFSNMTRV